MCSAVVKTGAFITIENAGRHWSQSTSNVFVLTAAAAVFPSSSPISRVDIFAPNFRWRWKRQRCVYSKSELSVPTRTVQRFSVPTRTFPELRYFENLCYSASYRRSTTVHSLPLCCLCKTLHNHKYFIRHRLPLPCFCIYHSDCPISALLWLVRLKPPPCPHFNCVL